jgi:tRNA pseudouridine38-40 synthase
VRTITACDVQRRGDDIDITVTADGYLYNMVRILAGTLCEAGAGRLAPEAVPGILASRDRKNAGPTLAAKGLFLKSVDYDTPIE